MVVREEKERPAYTPMEKLEMKYKHYPDDIMLSHYVESYIDGKLNKHGCGRIQVKYKSYLNDAEVEMWKAAPVHPNVMFGMVMTDKANNVYWVYIENHKLYQGRTADGSGEGGYFPAKR